MRPTHELWVSTTREVVVLPVKALATRAAILRPTAAASASFHPANRGVYPTQPLIPVSTAAAPKCEHTEALMSQRLRMSAWQVKSRTGFNGSTSDGPNSPARPREGYEHESPAGIVENSGENDGGTDSQAMGISPHSRRTGSAWSEYRCTTWRDFNCILADSTLLVAYFAPAGNTQYVYLKRVLSGLPALVLLISRDLHLAT
jgi:hypothetical protein